MKRFLMAVGAFLALAVAVHAEDVTVDLRYEPTVNTEPSPEVFTTVKLLRPVRIDTFTDKRAVADTYVGELKVNGQVKRVQAKTAVSVYATDIFRKVYGEWGGRSSADDQLVLKAEITQLRVEDADGYQARVGFHFFLKDTSGKVLWDGHSSGIVRGSGRNLTPESLSTFLSDILRATYTEMLEDDKLVGVWSGKVSNTYVIRDNVSTSSAQAASGR
jgi:hypothetical protein